MNRRLLFLLVLATSPLPAQGRIVRGMAAAPDVAIRLWVPAGFVEVQGWDRDSVDVRATPAAGATWSGGGTRDALKFALEHSRPDQSLPSATVRVLVPRRARVWIKSTTATVNVQGVHGELDLLQVGGASSVRDGRGVVRVESIDGPVLLQRVAASVTVRGGGGEVRLLDLAGTLVASTVNGALRLEGLTRPVDGRLESVGGPVTVTGLLAASSRLEIATHQGPITLAFGGTVPPRVEGSVPGSAIPPVFRTASGAGGTVVVRSFKGTLNVTQSGGI